MHLHRSTPSRRFLATNGGAGLVSNASCSHGSPLLSLHLFNEQNFPPDDIGILLPSCLAPDLFGAVLAHIEISGGTAAAETFVDQMLAAKERALEALAASQSAPPDQCCEAGARSGGREHTCRTATDSPS
ncbi:hypothetical protein [Streptomyces sp. NBC_00557]|uniref:hypothetical protein n=1 Tax=Streptomyces sp. NBC_00557 TaxID=2975776 RepID=UPI002E8091EA|nr:hypothetical protein [Streptomyces sp. NBC_00557]WUC36356.1 hypothetical protein OG956_20105 [Streptomyces sp. NBC_00557]